MARRVDKARLLGLKMEKKWHEEEELKSQMLLGSHFAESSHSSGEINPNGPNSISIFYSS